MNRQPQESHEFDISSWIIIAIAFAVFWPMGIVLLLRKLNIIPAFRQNSSARSVGAVQKRFDRYESIVKDKDSMAIEHIASAAGVSYDTALKELRQMLAQGKFGTEAYINYRTKTLVFKSLGTEPTQSTPQSAKRASGTRMKNREVNKKSKTLSSGEVALGVIGFLLIALSGIFGLISLASFFDTGLSLGTVWMVLTSLFCFLGGISGFGVRSRIKKRTRRFSKYLAVAGDKNLVELSVLARTAGVSESVAVRDIETMIERGLFSKSAYVDIGLGSLILSPDARPEYKNPEPEQPPENQYAAILREIRQLDENILNPSVSARIVQIEEITAKIFKTVEEKPEKLPQIKSFMSYYLPTTLKLLRSYSTFEKQGIDGENIAAARRDIERILDALSKGFAQQLDQLFSSDMLDISSDIDVLESMMKKDGLTGDDSGFQTMGSH